MPIIARYRVKCKRWDNMKVPKARKLPSGTWFIQLRLGGESYSVSAPTERECIRKAELVKAEHRNSKSTTKTKQESAKTLYDAFDDYIAKRSSTLSPATIKFYRDIQNTRFKDIMDRPFAKLSDDDIIRSYNTTAKELAGSTMKSMWAAVKAVLRDSGRTVPAVKEKQVIPADKKYLEPDQIPEFIEAVHGTSCEIPALLGLHSLRCSEILGLTWDNVDLKRKTIHVSGAIVHGENGPVEKLENKNASSNRVVPIMIPELLTALEATEDKTGHVVDSSSYRLYNHINTICESHNLPRIGVHGLRHSFASLAYHLGLPERVTMQIGGWSDYTTVQRIYTHIAKRDITDSVDKLTEFFTHQSGV